MEGNSGVTNYKNFASWLMTGLLTGGVYLAVWVMGQMLSEVREVNRSIADLNSKIAVTIDRQDRSLKDIDNLDARLRVLEK